MQHKEISGLYTALITPFKNREIDLISLEKIITAQIISGVRGIVLLGTTGEASSISDKERDLIIQRAVEIINGRIQVIVGVGTNNTSQSIDFAKSAQRFGADGVMVVSPYYNKPTQMGIIKHYEAINNAIDIPIIIYNNPSRASVDLLDSSIVQIAKLKNIVAIKDATGNLVRPISLLNALKEEGVYINQLSGEDISAVAFNAHGGVGCISVSSNIAPGVCLQIQNLMSKNKFQEAFEIQKKIYELHTVMFCESNPVPVKYGAYLLDLIDSYDVRLPLAPISQNAQVKVLRVIDAIQKEGLLNNAVMNSVIEN
ncbi:MAG: 4-hydroxy-tetrahydrodipicolinate synthase [Proteobacteria bacterium]|nr:4-hydroxy-tetrahydrodipicolinate synthase [Pseudomonadota bacterium]